MSAATPLARRLRASVDLATIRNRLLSLAREIEDDADDREAAGQGEDEALRSYARDLRELDRLVERFGREAREIARGAP